jgi:hypothetical protein
MRRKKVLAGLFIIDHRANAGVFRCDERRDFGKSRADAANARS